MISEIDIWRVAYLMLKRYGEEADVEAAIRSDELFEEGDHNGAAVWRRCAACKMICPPPPARFC